MPEEKPEANPVIETYRGEPIRKYPMVIMRCSVPEMKRFIDARLDYGLSFYEAIKQKNILCHNCHGVVIAKYNPS